MSSDPTDPTPPDASSVASPAPPVAAPAKAAPRDAAPVRSVVVACFVLAFGLLFAWNCWRRDFWNTDEPLFAEVARTMERTGDWIVPKCNVPFLELPPLTYWLSAAVHSITGLDPRAAYRLPVTAAAVLGLWLTFVAGKRFFSPSVGFLAVIIQASTGLYFWRAAWLDDDLIFAVCCQLAITCFALASRSTGRPALHALGWAGLGLCALTKSALLGGLLVGGPLLGFLLLGGRLAGARAGLGRVLRLPGFILALAIALPWFGAAAAREGKLLFEQHFLGAHFERIWSSPVHAEPPYFYLGTLLVGFLPWSLFLPLGILHGKDRLQRDGERLCTCWALFAFLALSIFSQKVHGYLLVAWPPLALLVAAAFFELREWFSIWEDFLREGVFQVVPVLMKVPVFLVLLAAGVYFGGYLEKISDVRVAALAADRSEVLWALGCAGAAAGVAYALSGRVRSYVRQKETPRAAYEVGCVTLILFVSVSFFYGVCNTMTSARAAMEQFAADIPPGARVAVYGKPLPEAFYYLGTKLQVTHLGYPSTIIQDDSALRALEQHLEQPGDAYLVTSRQELEALRSQFASLDRYLNAKESQRVGLREEFVLVKNRPDG